MNQFRAKSWLAVIFFWIGISGLVHGQHWYHYAPPPREFDWELFKPLSEYDFDEVAPSGEGYFFTASRMRLWGSRPPRVPIGSPTNSNGQSIDTNPEAVYIPNGVNYGYFTIPDPDSPDQPTGAEDGFQNLQATSDGGSFGLQFNTVKDAVPETPAGWGNRLEFGWIQSDTISEGGSMTGWMLSIMSEVDMNDSYELGFDDKRIDQLSGAQGLNGVDGDEDDEDGAVDPVAPTAGELAIPYQEGLTTVHINFADPFGLLLGYTDADGDGVIDDNDASGGINEGDRVRLGVVFDDLAFSNRTKMSGVELLAMRRKKKLHGNALAEMFLGVRYLEVKDTFRATGRGGILADSNWNNTALNRVVGPEFGLRIAKRSRRWTTAVSGRFLAGANLVNIRQNGALGDHLATTGPNGTITAGIPLSFGGADFINRHRDAKFSPVGEVRVQSTFHITQAVSLRGAWEGMIVGGMARGANTIDYALPTLGIIDRTDQMFSHGFTVGLEVNR